MRRFQNLVSFIGNNGLKAGQGVANRLLPSRFSGGAKRRMDSLAVLSLFRRGREEGEVEKQGKTDWWEEGDDGHQWQEVAGGSGWQGAGSGSNRGWWWQGEALAVDPTEFWGNLKQKLFYLQTTMSSVFSYKKDKDFKVKSNKLECAAIRAN